MATTLEGSIRRYIGLASDRKPGVAPLSDVAEIAPPVGSTFFESDTGTIYRYDNGAWRVPESTDQTNVLLGHILAELQRIHLHLQLKDGIKTDDVAI